MTYGVGIHDIDIDLYHSQKVCAGPSVSSSGLRTIVNECPARFYAYSDLNPNKVAPKHRDAFNFGRAAHALMLGEPEFHSKFIISPYETFNTANSRAWRDAQTKTVVKAADMATVNDMCRALKTNAQVARAFDKGKPEKSIIWKHKPTGIWCKARPDWMPDNLLKEFLVEYKTAATINPHILSNVVFRYGYHMQAAMFLDGLFEATGTKALGVAHVVQEKDAPFLAELRMFSEAQIELGRRDYHRALVIFAECLSTGKWPGYTREPQFFETPYLLQKLMEEEFHDDDSGSEETDTVDAG